MPRYRLNVVEVHYVRCRYVVDADTPKEAVQRAEAGDAESQEWVEDYEVMGRFATGVARKIRSTKTRR
jgi:hypothetical protein